MMVMSRTIGGFGCGIIFVLLPTYMKELLNLQNSSNEIVDILITQFGLGICMQYFLGECFLLKNVYMCVGLDCFFIYRRGELLQIPKCK